MTNVGWLATERILRLGVGFVVGTWVARYLGPEKFGTISYAVAFAALFSPIATLGTDTVVVRDLVRDPDRADSILGAASAIRVAGSLMVTILAMVSGYWMHKDQPQIVATVIIYAGAIIFRPFEIVDSWFQAQSNLRPVVITKNLAFLTVTTMKVGLVLAASSYLCFVLADFVGAALGAAGLLLLYRRHGQRFFISGWTFEAARSLLRDGWPLLIVGISVSIYMRIDQVMLKTLTLASPERAVGVYSAAARLSEIWYFVPMSLTTAVFPTLVRSRELGEGIYHARLSRLFSLMGMLALALALPMTFLSDIVVYWVFGAQYAEAAPILSIHIWTTLFVFWGVIGESWYINEGLTKLSLGRTLASAVLNICLNLLLIPLYSGIGAAVSTLISYACSAWLFGLLSARTRPLFLLQTRSLLFGFRI